MLGYSEMKKRDNNKKEVTKAKLKETKDSKVNRRTSQREPDPWKEIRLKLKPLGKAYNKFREKRRIAKQKEEERRLKENEKQRLIEEESLRLQELEERRFKKEKKIKEEKERRLKAQEKQRLEEKRIIEERNERIRQEQIYRERLIKGEEERIKQLNRVNEFREEERKLIEERNSKIDGRFTEEQKLKEKEQRLKEKEQRLKDEEQRLKDEERRLKEEKRLELEQKLKEEEKINSSEEKKYDDEKKRKRLNGTVKWFNVAKGYGFIKSEDQEKDTFVHSSSVQKSDLKYLKTGEQLTFEIEYTDKGPVAVNLEKTVDSVSRSYLKVVK